MIFVRAALVLILATGLVLPNARAAGDDIAGAAAQLLSNKGAGGKGKKATPPPVYAYVVSDGSAGEVCADECLKKVASTIQRRPGVKRAVVERNLVKVEVVPAIFKPEKIIAGVDGMKVEMRAPYSRIEIHFVEKALFPPIPRLEEDVLVVELGEDVRKAIDAAIKYRPLQVMKCIGKLTGSMENEAILERFLTERRPPFAMIPFMAEADLDGDRRPDLFLRLDGLPEMVVFNRKEGVAAVPLKAAGSVDSIPRCSQNPARYAKPVAKAKIKCLNAANPKSSGDAFELVDHGKTSILLMWRAKEFVTCEPLGDGVLPPLPPREGSEE
jgi:hypothetical protein